MNNIFISIIIAINIIIIIAIILYCGLDTIIDELKEIKKILREK